MKTKCTNLAILTLFFFFSLLATTDNLFFFKFLIFLFGSRVFYFYWRNFLQREKFKIRKISDLGGIPLPEVILFYFCQISMCVRVCVCSHEYRRLIKELYSPCGVYPDLAKSAKSSYG
jgi:hypothetical protein